MSIYYGCDGESTDPQRFAVSGTVTDGGQPVESASLQFRPGPENHGPDAGAGIEEGTFQIDADQGPGSGDYTIVVTLEAVNELKKKRQSMLPPGLNEKGGTVRKFKFERQISSDGENVFDFDLSNALPEPEPDPP